MGLIYKLDTLIKTYPDGGPRDENTIKILHSDEWAKHPIYTNYYISKKGNTIYNQKTENVNYGTIVDKGFITFMIDHDKRLGRKCHKLKWEAWNNKIIPEGYDVYHEDDDHTNNDLDNLQLLTKLTPPYPRTTEPVECKVCKHILPASNFGTQSSCRNGLGHQCKACERIRVRIRTMRKITNPCDLIQKLYSVTKSRALKTQKTFDLTLEDWLDIYHKQEGICAISGIKMTYTFTERSSNEESESEKHTWSIINPYNISPDQNIAGKGYTKDNLQFTCVGVNFMKGNLDDEIFMDFIHKIHLKSLSAV